MDCKWNKLLFTYFHSVPCLEKEKNRGEGSREQNIEAGVYTEILQSLMEEEKTLYGQEEKSNLTSQGWVFPSVSGKPFAFISDR